MNDGEDCAAQPQLLCPHSVTDLLHSVDAFLFDCDGVIWKGDKLIDGVPQTLQMLRSKGKKLVFVTNNSTKSRRHYAKKFHSLGISVSEEEIFSSSFAAAMFLKVHDFPREKKVYVIGEEGILEELELEGFTGLGGPEDGKKMVQLKPNCLFEHDKSVGAVVVGLDQYINYYKLQYATLCIRENPGCLFIATNRDAVGHMTDLQEWPGDPSHVACLFFSKCAVGAGCMVAAVCGSTQKEPIVVGKPSTFMMDFLLKKIRNFEVEIALKKMKSNKALGPDDISIEVWKCLVMDELTRNIQDDVPWYTHFVDDTVLVNETRGGVNTKLEIWREALEFKGFLISRTKTKYIECKFSNSNNESRGEVKIENQELPKSEHFRYLGSIITTVGEIDADVVHRIKAGWLKWRSVTTQSGLQDPSNHIQPEYYTSKVSDLLNLLGP
ncbi:hypothetical protein CsSME_00032827 [Camellia sinensis var. sinensis]